MRQGGGAKDERGFFIEPTLVQTTDPSYRLMREEIFGPVVTTYVYRDETWGETLRLGHETARGCRDETWADPLRLIDETSPYALTGAVFSQDRAAIDQASAMLRNAAGNFYVN